MVLDFTKTKTMTGENSHQVDRGRHHLGKLWDSWALQRTVGRKESPQALWQKIVPASEACSLKREIIHKYVQ